MSCGGPAEVLIQRHVKEVTTPAAFNRTWAEFRQGFCDSFDNLWIGNEQLYQATSVQDPPRRRLRVELSENTFIVSE